ncbi:MAG: methyltransferase domain-containing protein [Candidatus Magasanikbacteria bacterium]|nr:methyltransferase domain-containing protein [Candidatus Magasanikbacteria bacterium]
MENHSENIVVVGFGWVGQANALALSRMGYGVSYYDVVTPRLHYVEEYQAVYSQIKPLESLRQLDGPKTWYIVCIGDRVSQDGEQDISLIASALESLRGVEGKVILRSTVLPTLLETLPFDIYVPEFLHEIRAVEECLNPYYFVIGGRQQLEIPSFLEAWQSRARKIFKGTPAEAAYIKYLSNIWNAVRIAFVNEFGNSMALPETVDIRKNTERIVDFIFEGKSYLRYGQAFGGHCLPKDLRAYTRMSAARIPVPILKGALEANAYHEQIVAKYHTLTQWFSTWDYKYFSSRVTGLLLRFWKRLNATRSIRSLRRALKPLVWQVEQRIPEPSLFASKKHWERLAKKNPYFYTHPDTKSGEQVDEFEVRETGAKDYEFYVGQDEISSDASNKRILEIGSGTGRLTEFFAKDFKEVHGLDISPTMLAIAKKRLSSLANITWSETPGTVILSPDDYFDVIFSYDVFKHLPSEEVIAEYVKEIARTLKPGGTVKLQLRTGVPIHRWWWFYGVALTPEKIRILIRSVGLDVLRLELENPKSVWVWARKNI